jgi:LuxR family transcriptional regulator, maltose regulon positive regulatory protein
MAAAVPHGRDPDDDLLAAHAIDLLGQHTLWPELKLPPAGPALATLRPWQGYWSARLASHLTPAAARDVFAAALARFDALNEPHGALLALAALIETYYIDETPLQPMDDWIAELRRRLPANDQWPSDELQAQVMACGLAIVLRDQGHALLAQWAAQGQALLRRLAAGAPRLKLATFLLQYHCWRGEFGQATVIVDALPGVTADGLLPAEALVWLESVANHGRFTARHEQARAAIDAALQLLTQHELKCHHYAVHANAAATALAAADTARAADHLQTMRQLLGQQALPDQTHYWHLHCGWYLLRGDTAQALASAQLALANSQEVGGPYRTAVHQCSLGTAWLAHGDATAALPALQAALDASRAIGAALLSFTAALWLSQAMHMAQVDAAAGTGTGTGTGTGVGAGGAVTVNPDSTAPADSLLRQALAVAAANDFTTTAVWWRADWLAQRLARALVLGIEPGYVRRLVRRAGLRCHDPSLSVWPWPLRIHAFGEWRVERDGEPETPPGTRAQKRPFDLLRALLAYDGNTLPVSTALEWLWPDSEHSAQRRAFDAALSRLRKLLGDDSLLILDGGQLLLDRSRVWSDVGALAEQISRADQAHDLPSRQAAALALLDLVRGPFLPDTEGPWVTAARERHRRRFVNALSRLADAMEADAPAAAVQLYERALDADPLAESLHRRLIQLHAARGEQVEAARAWRHCQAMLALGAGLQPSADSLALVKRLGLA